MSKWCFGFVVINEAVMNATRIYEVTPNGTYETDVVYDTIGQCTGLSDKNGKLIYEGDIVKYLKHINSRNFDVCEIKWLNSGFTAEVVSKSHHYKLWNTDVMLEVIGNIHDKPGLAGGAK
jgi:uncharacterized phage protein (TIGR01671 family)